MVGKTSTIKKVDGRRGNGANNTKGVRTGDQTTAKSTRQAKELKELRKEVAAAQEQAAASVAEANIAKGRNREHERNKKRRVDGAQGGRKRQQRRWEARSGSARDDQVDRLKTLVCALCSMTTCLTTM